MRPVLGRVPQTLVYRAPEAERFRVVRGRGVKLQEQLACLGERRIRRGLLTLVGDEREPLDEVGVFGPLLELLDSVPVGRLRLLPRGLLHLLAEPREEHLGRVEVTLLLRLVRLLHQFAVELAAPLPTLADRRG